MVSRRIRYRLNCLKRRKEYRNDSHCSDMCRTMQEHVNVCFHDFDAMPYDLIRITAQNKHKRFLNPHQDCVKMNGKFYCYMDLQDDDVYYMVPEWTNKTIIEARKKAILSLFKSRQSTRFDSTKEQVCLHVDLMYHCGCVWIMRPCNLRPKIHATMAFILPGQTIQVGEQVEFQVHEPEICVQGEYWTYSQLVAANFFVTPSELRLWTKGEFEEETDLMMMSIVQGQRRRVYKDLWETNKIPIEQRQLHERRKENLLSLFH